MPAASTTPEITLVMPCLNEARSLAACIGEASAAMTQAGISGEIVIADNGSTDGSQARMPATRRHSRRVVGALFGNNVNNVGLLRVVVQISNHTQIDTGVGLHAADRRVNSKH